MYTKPLKYPKRFPQIPGTASITKKDEDACMILESKGLFKKKYIYK
jgi:hypothetical protein